MVPAAALHNCHSQTSLQPATNTCGGIVKFYTYMYIHYLKLNLVANQLLVYTFNGFDSFQFNSPSADHGDCHSKNPAMLPVFPNFSQLIQENELCGLNSTKSPKQSICRGAAGERINVINYLTFEQGFHKNKLLLFVHLKMYSNSATTLSCIMIQSS